MAARADKLDLQKHLEFLAKKRAEVEKWPAWKQQAAASYFAPWPNDPAKQQPANSEPRGE